MDASPWCKDSCIRGAHNHITRHAVTLLNEVCSMIPHLTVSFNCFSYQLSIDPYSAYISCIAEWEVKIVISVADEEPPEKERQPWDGALDPDPSDTTSAVHDGQRRWACLASDCCRSS